MKVVIVVIGMILLGMALSARIVKQYEQGVLFRLGRVPELNLEQSDSVRDHDPVRPAARCGDRLRC
jgi:hypothetical protein